MNNADMPANPVYSSNVLMQKGLTKREYAAIEAMQGMISNSNLNEGSGYSSDQIVSLSVQFADAILKELEI